MSVCCFCGQQLPEGKVFRSSECPSCKKDVKVCLNCTFYKPGAHWDCAETIGELVREKDRANYCDYFVLSKKSSDVNTEKDVSKSGTAKKNFNNLFN